MSEFWGYHLMLDCSQCNDLIKSYDSIYAFAKELVIEIDMVPYGEPQIVKFGSGNKEGYSLVQLIETSNICAHFVDEDNSFYLDVFSCKVYDVDVVERIVNKYFEPGKTRINFITRQA